MDSPDSQADFLKERASVPAGRMATVRIAERGLYEKCRVNGHLEQGYPENYGCPVAGVADCASGRTDYFVAA
jgi:hypothetical protein